MPLHRIQRSDYASMARMVSVFTSENSDWIAQAEADAIAHHRRLGRGGVLVNARGDARCLNRNPGGESAHHGISPFFLYVVFGVGVAGRFI